jgi:hypothetical protein
LPGGHHRAGIVLFDELKLVSDFYSNVQDGKVVAFAEANSEKNNCTWSRHATNWLEWSLGTLLKKIFPRMRMKTQIWSEGGTLKKCEECEQWIGKKRIGKKDAEPKFVPAVYVNLFQIKSAGGDAMNAEFVFNNGSLTSDNLLIQLLRVIPNYKIVGARIYGSCSGCGGSKTLHFSKH